MKLFVYMITVCMLLLSCMGCKDNEEAVHQISNNITLAAYQNDHQHSEKDDCSPLCSCNCCNQSVNDLFAVYDYHFNAVTHLSKKIQLHIQSAVVGYNCMIWQPPQMNNPFI